MSAPVPAAAPAALLPLFAHLTELFNQAAALPDARGVEPLVHEGLREADRLMMQACVAEKCRQEEGDDVREVRCRHCGEWAELLEAGRDRTMIGVRGEVRFTRRVYQCGCRGCRRERAPLDEQLGLGPKERFSPLARKKTAWAGAMLCSYEKAAEDLRHQAELAVSPKQVQRITEQTAERALARQDREVEHWGRPAAWDHVLEPEERPETLVIEMDGTCVMGRGGEGREVKCATVFGLSARARSGSPGKERPLLLNRAYCATAQGMQSFRAMVWALCVSWGIRSAKRVVVIGDGADWLWNFSADRFHFQLPGGRAARPVEILDFYHAAENLTKACNAIFRDPEGRAAKDWQARWRGKLKDEGAADALAAELTRRSKQAQGEAQAELQRRAEYFRKHAGRMNYPAYAADNLPIGSGAIEGTCKNLIKGRMSCVGQRWGEAGIEGMAALRVRIFNQRYEDLWENPDELRVA